MKPNMLLTLAMLVTLVIVVMLVLFVLLLMLVILLAKLVMLVAYSTIKEGCYFLFTTVKKIQH